MRAEKLRCLLWTRKISKAGTDNLVNGRIIKGIGGLYFIDTEYGIYKCSARGKFRKSKITPTVGDFVEIQVLDEENKKGSLEKINDRKNLMFRPRVSNIDTVIIIFAARSPDINFDLLDRFLIVCEQLEIPEVVICINKSDLIDVETKDYTERIYSPIYRVIYTNTQNGENIDLLKDAIRNKVSVVAGPSGVGKSSIINRILPEGIRKTGEISRKIARGKHTTREVELLNISENTYISDTPGFTSLNIDYIKADELKYYFREFKPFLSGCRFSDCRHLSEPDCQLKKHVGKEISAERYERFRKFYEELQE